MNKRVLRKYSQSVQFPKKILIGDPSYFEEGITQYVYNKSFRGKKDWVGTVEVLDEVYKVDLDEDHKDIDLNTNTIRMIFSINDDMLKLFENGKCKKYHRISETVIGVDTACYDIRINDNYTNVLTGGDGEIGDVLELYNGKKLEGIIITISTSAVLDYENIIGIVEYLFDVKLEKNKID